MALVYSYFPDHAMRNVYQSLSEGGEAQLHIPCYRSPDMSEDEEEAREFAATVGVDIGNENRNHRLQVTREELEKEATVMEKDGIYCIQK